MPIPSDRISTNSHMPARDLVLGNLRDWIVDGSLAPGEIIRDAEVARAFNVSRTPVREALLQLRSEGFIETKPKGWTQVATLDLQKAEHVFRLVVDLEALAARLAAEREERDLAPAHAANGALEALIARVETGEDGLDWKIVEANDCFHEALVVLADNPYLGNVLLPLKALMRRFERVLFSDATPIGRVSLAQHDELLKAIERGDADAAAALAERNLDNSPIGVRLRRRRSTATRS